MRINVCVKQVPDPEHFPSGQYDARGFLARGLFQMATNPVDKNACELALALAGDDPVETYTVGPENAKQSLRDLLAMGATGASIVTDPLLEGADLISTALSLAAAMQAKGGFDMVVCGKQSTDAGNGSLPAVLAEMLSVPCVLGAEKVELDGETILVHVPMDGGVFVWRVPLPAVISVTKNINTPRLPSLRGMTKAMQTPIAMFDLDALGIQLPVKKATIISQTPLKKEVKAQIIEGETTADKVGKLVLALKESGLSI